MKKNNENSKISIYVEGVMEDIFIKYLKTQILDCRTISICKIHSKPFDGGFDKNKISNSQDCCNSYVVIDEDNKSNEDIVNIKKVTSKNNNVLILNRPSFEIILLSLFIELKTISWTPKELDRELARVLAINKYKHTKEIIEKICNSNKKKLAIFEKNLYFLNKNNKSNFIEIYKVLKGNKNEIR